MKRIAVLIAFLPLVISASAIAQVPHVPTYPIAADVYTTRNVTVVARALPANPVPLLPCELSLYAINGYGLWDWDLAGYPVVKPDMQTGVTVPSVADPSAPTLLSFFTISDVHITDKESPAQVIYFGYEGGPLANSSAYSGIILSTTHVLDAAVQTINALHQQTPFDFGIALGDAANNNQYNELRWYIDVLDGKMITPSSGAHKGARTIGYQKPYQAAGLDRSIPWYQAVGNHDQFWTGCARANDYIQKTIVGPTVLNLGEISPSSPDWSLGRGFYTGVVDGTTPFGTIIDAGAIDYFPTPPRVAADATRRSLTVKTWMGEFLTSTSKPAGHGFTKQMIKDGCTWYHFYPKANIPIKVIVFDDTDKAGSANAALDYVRYNWLVKELDEGEAAGELMIVCAHIPIRPYAQPQDPQLPPPANNPLYPFVTIFASYSQISENTLLAKLHTYKNLILWLSGHAHRNTITPQPDPSSDPEYGFWEVETPSLRDFPQQFRRIEIVRNSDGNISIFAINVDPAISPDALPDGTVSPAWISRSYAIGTQEIFKNQVWQGPNVGTASGVYNAELVKQLSPAMQAKLALLTPVVSSFGINGTAASAASTVVALSNTVTGSTPTQFLASEAPSFNGAAWEPYSKTPAFTLTATAGTKTVYFKVRDASGAESAVATDSIVLRAGAAAGQSVPRITTDLDGEGKAKVTLPSPPPSPATSRSSAPRPRGQRSK